MYENDEGFEKLAIAIIKEAVDEYIETNDKAQLGKLEHFFKSEWCQFLSGGIDGQKIIDTAGKRRRERIKNEQNKTRTDNSNKYN